MLYGAFFKWINYIDENPDFGTVIKSKNDFDYYSFFTLHKIFLENDLPQIVLADDGYIYRIDCSDAFAIDDMTLMSAGINAEKDKNYDTRELSSINNHRFGKYWELHDIDRTIQHYIREFGYNEVFQLLQPLYAIQKVRKPYIDKFLNTLCYFYPECVGEYYNEFFAKLKRAMRTILPFLVEKYK